MNPRRKLSKSRAVLHIKLDRHLHHKLKTLVVSEGGTIQSAIEFLIRWITDDPGILKRQGYKAPHSIE